MNKFILVAFIAFIVLVSGETNNHEDNRKDAIQRSKNKNEERKLSYIRSGSKTTNKRKMEEVSMKDHEGDEYEEEGYDDDGGEGGDDWDDYFGGGGGGDEVDFQWVVGLLGFLTSLDWGSIISTLSGIFSFLQPILSQFITINV